MCTHRHTELTQIKLGIHLTGRAYPSILKPSYLYAYNQTYTLKDKWISHTYTTRHSTGLLAHRNTVLLSLRIKRAHLLTQSDMQSHTYSTVHTHKPTQTLTHLHTPSCGLAHTQIHTHPQCPWTDTNTHRLHTFTVTHIYPFLGPDASKPEAGFSPFLIKCFFRKVYSIPRSPTPSYPHHGVFLVSDFPLFLPWP